jgi:hypothetical protein
MSSIVEPQTARPLPSVSRQVVRGLLAALVIGLGFAVVAALVTGQRPWSSDRWANLFGDPQITLADGVAASDAPATGSMVTVDPSVLKLGTSTAALEKAFGSPVRELRTPAEVARAGGGQVDAETLRVQRWFSTPMGAASFLHSPSGQVPVVSLAGAPDVVATDPGRRAQLAQQFVRALGFAAGTGLPAGTAVKIEESQVNTNTIVTAVLTVGGSPTSGFWGENRLIFDASGHLTSALLWGAPVVAVEPYAMVSASSAFDDLRHHRAGALGEVGGLPVVVEEFRLGAGAKVLGGAAEIPAAWTFREGTQWFPIYPNER